MHNTFTQAWWLTTGADILVGTVGNDTILATDLSSNSFFPSLATLNAGDSIDGGNGNDTLKVLTSNGAQTVDLSGVTLTSIENIVIQSANNNLYYVNLDGNAFASVTMQNLDGAYVYGAVSTSNVTILGGKDNSSGADVYFDDNADASVTINNTVVGGTNGADTYGNFEHNLTAATKVNATLNLKNANSDQGDWAWQDITIGGKDASVTVNVNIDGAKGTGNSYAGAEAGISHDGTATITANINIANSDSVYAGVYADNNRNGSGKNDVANITLSNVSDSYKYGFTGVEVDDFETVNVSVTGKATMGNIDSSYAAATPFTSQAVNINAAADLTLLRGLNAANSGSVKVTVTGAGNVDLGNYDGTQEALSATVTDVIDASALTGKLRLVAQDATSITSGSGDDSITLSSSAFGKVATGAGDDKVTLGSGAAAGTSIDAGAGTDTLAGNAFVLSGLDNSVAGAATIAGFEALEVTSSLNVALDTTKIQAGLNVVTLAAASTTGAAVTFAAGASTLNLKAAAVDAFAVASAGLGIADIVTVTNMAPAVDVGIFIGNDMAAAVVAFSNVATPKTAVDVFNGKAINATGVETLILNGSGNGAATKQTVGAIALTGTDLDGAGVKTVLASTSVKFVGTNSFEVASIAADTVDASGLTGTAGLKASTSALQVTGSAAADDLIVTAVTAAAIADLPATTANEAVAAVNATVSTGAGNDNIDVSTSGTGATTINAGAGDDTIDVRTSGTGTTTINAGDGNDAVYVDQRGTGVLTVNLGAGNDSFSVNTTGCGPVVINGTDVIDGGAGTDTLLLSLIGSANVGAFKNFEVMDAVGLDHALDVDLLNATNTVTEFIASASVNSGASLINVGAGVGVRVTGSMNDTFLSITQKTAGALTVTLDADSTVATFDNDASLFITATNATSLKAVFAADSAFVQTSSAANTETINLIGSKATSLEVVSGGTNATNVLNYTAGSDASGNGVLTSLTITGTQHLDISGLTTADISQLATIDASAFTGGLTADLGVLKDGGTIKLGSGVDLIMVSTAGVMESISGFEKAIASAFGTTALAASVADSDTLVFTGSVADAGSFSGGVIAKGVLSFTGAGPTTFAGATAVADQAANGVGEAVLFEYVGNSYLFVQGGDSADTMVKLVGMTGVSQFEANSADHFILG